MRLCYIIMLHHKFDQAVRLINRLAGSDTYFVIHIDKLVDDETYERIRGVLAHLSVFYSERHRARWGSFAIAAAVSDCIDLALDKVPDADRYTLLSGQCYPIRSNAYIFDFFRNHPNEEFIEAIPLSFDKREKGWTPYYRFQRFHIWIGERRFALPFLSKKLPKHPVFHAAMWWSLSNGATKYVRAQLTENETLRRYFRRSFLVDEAYIPTIVNNSPFADRVVKECLTYQHFTPTSGPHPKVLMVDDMDKLIASDKLFARKFDADIDSEILDRLDECQSTSAVPY